MKRTASESGCNVATRSPAPHPFAHPRSAANVWPRHSHARATHGCQLGLMTVSTHRSTSRFKCFAGARMMSTSRRRSHARSRTPLECARQATTAAAQQQLRRHEQRSTRNGRREQDGEADRLDAGLARKDFGVPFKRDVTRARSRDGGGEGGLAFPLTSVTLSEQERARPAKRVRATASEQD